MQFLLNFIYKLLKFSSFSIHFPFCFQETNSLSNYQFLFQDLAITTLIGVTSKNFKTFFLELLPLLPSLHPRKVCLSKAAAGMYGLVLEAGVGPQSAQFY